MDSRVLEHTPSWQWPEDAGAILLDVLEDANAPAADRAVAAELAGDIVVVNDELVAALLRIVSDAGQPDELRGQAAVALGPVLETGDIEGFDLSDPLADVPITEATFHRIQRTLRDLYHDASAPMEVRRRILEASVRAPEEWHAGAVRAAPHSNEPLWRLTAVFCMHYIKGFDAEIVEALESDDEETHYQAVLAAGAHGVEAAWPHVVRIIERERSDKLLLLAPIEAVASIRPDEAEDVLAEPWELDDEEIEDAIHEALSLAGVESWDDEEDEEDGF
ncbi:MAG TPA: hypothetical protein VFQ38_24840 [Longimicrobiales bacterium]|nr:hypothetical protein [Longimicrobiales bacterium]